MSHSFEECLYCDKTGLKKGSRVILESNLENPPGKIRAASCLPCTEIEDLHFDLTDLSLVSDVPFENFKNYPCITNSFRAFSKKVPESKKKKTLIGLLSRNLCRICWNYTKFGQKIADHNAEFHSKEELVKCTFGCGSYCLERELKWHKQNCGILCPVCETTFAEDTGHFVHVHPCVTCPFPGCATAFRIKKNEHEEDVNGTNDFLKHIMTYHVWKIDKNAEASAEDKKSVETTGQIF
ncbi:Hypothetical predicted protein [Cloeon dipterum]|uniref:Uncharacterized protein n=1 Tax=Cloeon dipterum TaxID=197152 RepID=A0A8S1DLL8_9INSE|nr:Hypothetical predicted protein [Cloeon dipterum]